LIHGRCAFAGERRIVLGMASPQAWLDLLCRDARPHVAAAPRHATCRLRAVIRKLSSGQYRLYSRKIDARTGKRRNLGTFDTRAAAERHERAVQYFKRRS
jgi:hypothetical protein